jgi:hypothetical protein
MKVLANIQARPRSYGIYPAPRKTRPLISQPVSAPAQKWLTIGPWVWANSSYLQTSYRIPSSYHALATNAASAPVYAALATLYHPSFDLCAKGVLSSLYLLRHR